ncbi:hypothetical protein M2262_000542 [Pseudomonas sp. BIGb0408]|uniref:DUF4124 domain-containing protein n=1 Tax=Phytopseudomonas flavescens TaxID=29435 RepID=A0A7Y9XP77_9GAMM|nr:MULTISPECIES: DUF4124 domain-containing protein [Pseudomonas]MCW2290492.1 hypothetical protein [Pseudomonas sp. BIGb0408]NYH74935.1 hypothetical protein [Pseudomonas flavescens]
MRALLFGLLLIALPCLAQVYTYVDAEGNRVFTDKPRDGNAQQVQMAPSNRIEPAQPRSTPPTAPVAPQPVLGYELLRITIPQPDATINDNAGNLIVTVNSDPALHPGHSYRLLLDGQPVGSAGRSPVFPLENVDRGTHQIAVEIITEGGIIVERTPSQPFHMKRVTLAQKRKVRPCEKTDYGVRPECPLKDKPKEEDKGIISILPFL